jgi:outer membrane protein assembly factor BamB
MRRAQIHLISTVLVSLLTVSASAQLTSLKSFDIPGPSNWVPEGCRDVEQSPDALTSRATWRSLHSDVRSSDEITGALAPVFETEWIAEPNTYNPTGPVFDSDGNLYFSPLAPIEPVVMISLDPADGSRRWAIPATTNAPVGFHTPLVLKDPTDPDSEALFLVLADRAIAVRPDGSTIWDVPVPFPTLAGIIGIQYHGPSDSLIAASTDGYLLGIDRSTGAVSLPLVELPGEATPTPPSTIPLPVVICMQQKIAQLTDLGAAGMTFLDFINLLLGNGIEVANSFSIDPNSGRLWVAATAPDEADGTIDGISEFGALYGIDVVSTGSGYAANQACRADFSGGTAATPTIKADGTRIYAADNAGSVLAYSADDCSEIWSLDVGEQVFGSIGVSSDNQELYASSRSAVRQLFDRGDHGELGWTSAPEVFDIPAPLQGVLQHFNLLLAGVSATGVSVQVGVGVRTAPRDLPFQQAVVVLDRETGEPKWASEGLDESVAVMSMAPNGSSYIGNSPLRRIIALCILELQAAGVIPPVIPLPFPPAAITPQPVGGITKYGAARLDLLARDASCAAADRALNAWLHIEECSDSAQADVTQVLDLIAQARAAGEQAFGDGDLTKKQRHFLNKNLDSSEELYNIMGADAHEVARWTLGKACDAVSE